MTSSEDSRTEFPTRAASRLTEIDVLHRRLAQILDSISKDPARGARFRPAEGGYERAPLPRVGDVEPVVLRWASGSESLLHGHGMSAALLRVLRGYIIEYQFVAVAGGYRCRKAFVRPGKSSFLPPGAFHHVHAISDALGIHAYTPALESPTTEVPADAIRLLREAFERDLSHEFGTVPVKLIAALRAPS